MQQVVSRAGDRALLIDLGSDVSAAQLHAAAASARGGGGGVQLCGADVRAEIDQQRAVARARHYRLHAR